MRTLDEVIAALSSENQDIVKEISDEMILEVGLKMVREKLQFLQKHVAARMGVVQPALTQLE